MTRQSRLNEEPWKLTDLLRHLVLLPALLGLPPVLAAEEPILQLDTGGHRATIRDIVFTPDGNTLVSASDDKTLRIWDWRAGRTTRILRGQIGPGHEGKLFAMALSPDGQRLAVGGYLGANTGNKPLDQEEAHKIRLIDLQSGEIEGLLQGHTNVVAGLAFSPDGRRLVSGSRDKTAIIWDLPRRRLLQRLQGHSDAIYAVAFSRDGERVVTGSDDHRLKLWRVRDGAELATLEGHTASVYAVAYAPEQDLIASGSLDHSIRLWDGRTGSYLRTLANQGTMVGSLSFSLDGRRLLSGNTAKRGPFPCHVYEVASGKELVIYRGHGNIVLATDISPDGRWAATGGGDNHEIDIWDLRSGERKQRLVGSGSPVWAVGFSTDGRQLLWGRSEKSDWKVNDYGDLEYKLRLPMGDNSLGSPEPYAGGASVRAHAEQGDWSLTTRQGGQYGRQAVLEVRQGGRIQVEIERHSWDGYSHTAYGFTPDGRSLVSGGAHGVLSAYRLDGAKLGDFVGHTGTIWAVAVSPDGRLLASGADDQTVRLWNLQSRELLLTLYQGVDGEWVAWTPSGHYAASPDGDRLVGWQLNRGVDRAADYVEAAQLRERLYRPDIAATTLRLGNLQQALAQGGQAHFDLAQQLSRPPPRFEIAAPAAGARVSRPQLKVRLAFAANLAPADELQAFVNGRQVTPRGRLALPESQQRFERTLTLPLEPGENRIVILARNATGETSRELSVTLQQSTGAVPKGDLYLVAIGVSDYPELRRGDQLTYAAADARAFHQALMGQAGRVYRRVEARLLADDSDRPPTKDNIEDALDLFRRAGPDDTVILFLAGHGLNEDQEYYFLPRDAERREGRLRKSRVLKWLTLQDALQGAQGRRLMLVDTCHAGNAFNNRIVKDAADAQILVISATSGQNPAIERDDLQHGIFTHALLQGLSGKADSIHDGQIRIKELDSYLSNLVERLSGGVQKPVLYAPGGLEDFVLSRYE